MSTRSRDPRSVQVGDFPAGQALQEQVRFLLQYTVLAPSGHNTQPWLFRLSEAGVDVYADRRRALPIIDPHDRELTISCGAAIGFFAIAARRFGLRTDVALSRDPQDDLVARIAVASGEPPDEHDIALFEAITARRTNRNAYAVEKVPGELLAECASVASHYGVELSHATDDTDRSAIADLVAEGDRRQFADPDFRRELAGWVRSSRLGSGDGLSASGFGMPDALAPVARMIVRTFNVGKSVAAGDAQKVRGATPALLLLATRTDDKESWTNAGRALSRILLHLTACGVSAAFLNPPIEEEEGLRSMVARGFGTEMVPQLLLRIGRPARDVSASARRPVDEVEVT